MTAALNTKAFWIWENSSSDILCASKEFDISRNPVSARLVSVADDTYMLYINGKAVQSGAYWIQYQETDLLPYLKKGQNVIAVYATNQGGAAGFLADLELTFADGSKERIISDKSWMSSGEVPAGACDVAVADGWTGNIVLKTIEGVGKGFGKMLKGMLMKNILTKLSALVLKDGIRGFKDKMDSTKRGVAPLLGIAKPVIKAHGNSNALAFRNAVEQAKIFVETDINGTISAEIAKMKEEKAE